MREGNIAWVDTDREGADEDGFHQIRACLRGRSVRELVEHPDRLKYPMRRIGRRGEGRFERIGWDEALDIVAENLKRVVEQHGNEAVYVNFGSGVMSVNIAPFLERLMCLYGGFLGFYGDYSHSQIEAAMEYMYGERDGNSHSDIAQTNLVVLFGDNTCENKMCGASGVYHLRYARESSGPRVVVIDPRYSETAANCADWWIPIRPGTDGALATALAYVMIVEGLVDRDFLARYCVGYDESTLPAGAVPGSDYRSYITGEGQDRTPKTPEWASAICGVPTDDIVKLAREIAQAKPCAIYQGKAPQRQSNGEQTARAIATLAALTGNVGIAGGNSGADFGTYRFFEGEVPVPPNPVETLISVFTWTDAIERGPSMTARHDGVVGAERLSTGIKFLWNYAGNCIANQHSDVNRTHEILQDETKCEFIVVIDTFKTASANYADILLPDLYPLEQPNLITSDWAGNTAYLIANRAAVPGRDERKTFYWMLTEIARRLGLEEEFTCGRDEEGWRRFIYEEARADDPDLPPYEDLLERGVYRRRDPDGHHVAFAAFREDPAAHPLDTPSGKIEIYSQRVANLMSERDLATDEVVDPLPIYAACAEGIGDPAMRTYPLQLVGFHFKGRAHSCYANLSTLQSVARQEAWINPADAGPRHIQDGDLMRVYNGRGEIRIEAKVTPRIVPGTVAVPEGAWHEAEMFGDRVDVGGCINTLTTQRPSPLAKGNPQNTNLVQIERVRS